jgi:hypothetical protein
MHTFNRPRLRALAAAIAATTALAGMAILDLAISPSASADVATTSGYLEVVLQDGTIDGCYPASASGILGGTTTDPTAAAIVTATPGSQQNLEMTNGTGPVLGLDDSQATYPLASPDSEGYGFIETMSATPAGEPSEGGQESSIWNFDPETSVLTTSWVYDDGTLQSPLASFSTPTPDGGLAGGSNDLAADQANFGAGYWRTSTFVLGDQCSGTYAPNTQDVAFSSTAPNPAYVGGSYQASATGSDSGNPLTFASETADVCTTTDDGMVSFLTAGTCTIDANQAGGSSYAPGSASQSFDVTTVPSSVAVAVDPVVSGQGATATATVTVPFGTADGTVQFQVDGADLGDPVDVATDGTATSPSIDEPVDTYDITGVFTPSDTSMYDGSSDTQTLVVDQASTTTTLTVRRTTLRTVVAPVAPGAGMPTGDVTFSVDGNVIGSAQVSPDGTATLTYSVATDATHAVAAAYEGDDEFLGSSDSTSRSNPTIEATLASDSAPLHGWYRNPVTVSYTCDANGDTLRKACPAPVALTHQPGRTVTRTIHTVEGGVAMANTVVHIDMTAPRVVIDGVKRGKTYAHKPTPVCHGRDGLSGLASCKLTKTTKGSKTTVVVVATDVAGNTTTKSKTYTLE